LPVVGLLAVWPDSDGFFAALMDAASFNSLLNLSVFENVEIL